MYPVKHPAIHAFSLELLICMCSKVLDFFSCSFSSSSKLHIVRLWICMSSYMAFRAGIAFRLAPPGEAASIHVERPSEESSCKRMSNYVRNEKHFMQHSTFWVFSYLIDVWNALRNIILCAKGTYHIVGVFEQGQRVHGYEVVLSWGGHCHLWYAGDLTIFWKQRTQGNCINCRHINVTALSSAERLELGCCSKWEQKCGSPLADPKKSITVEPFYSWNTEKNYP